MTQCRVLQNYWSPDPMSCASFIKEVADHEQNYFLNNQHEFI